ncbi:hypothetical protein [Sphingomonas sp. CFBP 13733]|nr:hypothetical protein [Sphingomonas sp. CFBP 13733]
MNGSAPSTNRRPAIDLTAAAKDFGKRSEQRNFIKKVSRLNDAESAKCDLKIALGLLMSGSNLVRGTQPLATSLVQDESMAQLAGAAFSYALILYVRVVTNNDDRGRVSVDEGAPQHIKEAHARIVQLRHKGVGHFGHTVDHPGGALAQDRVLVCDHGDGPFLTHEHYRANYREKNLIDLQQVIDHGLRAVEGIIDERRQIVINEIRRMSTEDKAIINGFATTSITPEGVGTTLSPSGTGAI